MQATRTDPPNIPVRSGGWPVRRAPRWAFAAAAVLLAIGVAVGLVHHPTKGERAADLRSLVAALRADIQSCSGGVGESLQALRAIRTGTSHDLATAIGIARTGSANCSPANNELLDDLTSVEVPESLSSFRLAAGVTDLIGWAAPDAIRVQSDVAAVLADIGKPGEATAVARLGRALDALDAKRAAVYADFAPAIKALAPRLEFPVLHGRSSR